MWAWALWALPLLCPGGRAGRWCAVLGGAGPTAFSGRELPRETEGHWARAQEGHRGFRALHGGFGRVHVDVCGCVWIYVDACGCMWMCVDACGCVDAC